MKVKKHGLYVSHWVNLLAEAVETVAGQLRFRLPQLQVPQVRGALPTHKMRQMLWRR